MVYLTCWRVARKLFRVAICEHFQPNPDEMEKNPKKKEKDRRGGLGAIIIIRRNLTDDAINLSIALVLQTANLAEFLLFFLVVGDLISLMSCVVWEG